MATNPWRIKPSLGNVLADLAREADARGLVDDTLT